MERRDHHTGVLLDVPRYRGVPFVTADRPVHGWELEEIAGAEGIDVQPGDALIVHSGRGAFEQAGNTFGGDDRPGLHVSCAKFIRDHDVALLAARGESPRWLCGVDRHRW